MTDERAPKETPRRSPPRCPFCLSQDTELISLFGQTLMGSQYYCRNCRSVFEAVRWTAQTGDEEFDDDA